MDNTKESIELTGFGFKPEKSASSLKTAVATISFGGTTLRTAVMKFNTAAIAADALNLKLTKEEAKVKLSKRVSVSPSKLGQVVIFNSTEIDEIPEEHLLKVTSSSHSVKLSAAGVKAIYAANGIDIDDKLKTAVDWIFTLVAGSTAIIGGKPIDVFTITKLKEKPVTVVKKKTERSIAQKAQTGKIAAWRVQEQAKGKSGTIAEYWKYFYAKNPALKAWVDAEKAEDRDHSLKKFLEVYPKTVILS